MESLNKNLRENQTNDQMASDEKLQKVHIEELGLGMPEGYFSKSKSEILAKVGYEDKSRVVPLYRNKIVWAAAAAIALLVALTFFRTNRIPKIDGIPTIVSDTLEQLNKGLANEDAVKEENDILISSIFVEDSEVDEFVDNYMLKEALFEESDIN